MTTATISDQLARVYREARVLVLGDRSPKIDRAFALYREFTAVRTSCLQQPDDNRSEWEATLLEKTRRATIVALRHQALVVRDRWVEGRASLGNDQSSPHVNPEHALQLAVAALELHVRDDPDLSKTTQTVDGLRQSLTAGPESVWSPAPRAEDIPTRQIVTAAQSPQPPSMPRAPSVGVLPPSEDLMPVSLASTQQPDTASQALSGRRDHIGGTSNAQGRARPAVAWAPAFGSVLILIAAGFAFFAIGIGKSGPAIDARGRQGSSVSTHVAALATPRDTIVTEVPRSPATPSAVDETAKQAVTIKLRSVRPAETHRPPSTTGLPTERARFDATLRAGIELYKRGWFGPAAGRFKAAAALEPRSAEAHLWLGRALLRADRHAEARRALEKVVALGQSGPLAKEAAILLGRVR